MAFAPESPFAELVEHFRLDAEDHGTYSLISVPDRRRRGAKKHEKWVRRKPIGQGSFGVVWLEVKEAKEEDEFDSYDEVRAVKQVVKGITSPESFGVNCARELYAMAKLMKHYDYFADFFGWYETSENVYFSMEYFPEGDLGNCVKAALDGNHVQAIASQLLAGLHIIHQNGITHRDLKPSNIFVKSREPWWIKIGNFGLSKRIGRSTYLHTVAGTTYFMAPEVAEYDGSDGYTNAVDMWSLGCVLFYLLTLKVPFMDKRSTERYLAGIENCLADVLEQHRVSTMAIEFLMELLSPKPEGRPSAESAAQSEWLTSVSPEKTGKETSVSQKADQPITSTSNTENWQREISESQSSESSLLDELAEQLLPQLLPQPLQYHANVARKIRPSYEDDNGRVAATSPVSRPTIRNDQTERPIVQLQAPSRPKKERSLPDPFKVRTWTSRVGDFKVEAQFIEMIGEKVHLHKTDGVHIAVPVEKISLHDLNYIDRLRDRRTSGQMHEL